MKTKRGLALLMALCLCLSMVSVRVEAGTGGKSVSDAVEWADNHATKKSKLDYDGVYGAQCVDLIKYYYVYLGNSAVQGSGKDYSTNAVPSGWSRIQKSNGFVPQPGDVAIWTSGGNGHGHVAIVISANTSTMTVVEQNWDGEYCSKRSGVSVSGIWGVIRPDFISSSFDFWAGEDGETISGQHTFWWKQEGYGSCDVNLDLNGKALGTIYPDENGLFSYTLDTTQYENGTYTFGAIIRSLNGLEKYVTRTIHIDNGSFGFWAGEDGETISGTHKFWWKQTKYEDCDVNLKLNGNALGTIYPDASGLFSYAIDTTKYENGIYTISATIRSANKPAKTVSRTIHINNGEMFFDFWSGEDEETISGTYKFWWKQVGYGACNITIDMNETVLATKTPDENGLFSHTLDTKEYENGTYTIGAKIQGANGSGKYVTRTIHINNAAAMNVLGDLDLDGDVDAYDLTALARHVGGIEMVEGQSLANADVDGDGDVDAYDLTKHARYVGGIITDWDQN